ncbi:S8 family peptidase [Aquimarina longa]|uniref:S8 family peptidase n=1 Tax=Aquimarina longa TaxID=1080221 RepID=UPI000781066B|nr:S8 family serine peptidase [Aquimarina longa]
MNNKFLTIRNISLVAIGTFMIISCQKEDLKETSLSTGQENTTNSLNMNNDKGEYIVVLKNSANNLDTRINEILSANDIDTGKVTTKFENIFQGFATKNITEAEIATLREDHNIDYIESNKTYQGNSEESTSVMTNPNLPSAKKTGIDPHRGQLPLQNIDHSPTSRASWGVLSIGGSRDGRGKVAWIIDSGILDIPELNIDKQRSRNFNPANGGPENWQDGSVSLHGTKIAGILAAKDNGIGTTGIAAGATVVSVRISDNQTGSSDISQLAGIEYVTKHAKRGDVWNFSNNFNEHFRSKIFNDAFKKLAAVTYGTVSAGNFNEDVLLRSPTNEYIDGIKVVGSHDGALVPNSDSNFGVKVSLWAPGYNVSCIYIADRGYLVASGTSFAAPYVAGMMLILGGDAPTAGQINKNGRWAGIAHW